MDALKIEIFIDAKSVTPLRKEVDVSKGRTVLLVTRSDHDVSLIVKGPKIDKSTFIARLTTITTTFVANDAGVVTVKSSDPAATIARLVVR